jgi:hypothetical protein
MDVVRPTDGFGSGLVGPKIGLDTVWTVGMAWSLGGYRGRSGRDGVESGWVQGTVW